MDITVSSALCLFPGVWTYRLIFMGFTRPPCSGRAPPTVGAADRAPLRARPLMRSRLGPGAAWG